MLTIAQLKTLKRKLPGGWAEKVKEKTGFGLTKIREALKDPEFYDADIVNAALEIAEAYQKELIQKAEAQKKRIQDLVTH